MWVTTVIILGLDFKVLVVLCSRGNSEVISCFGALFRETPHGKMESLSIQLFCVGFCITEILCKRLSWSETHNVRDTVAISY